MKLENKLAISALVVGVGVGLSIDLGNSVETNCETYQGYRDNSTDGERIFVFDEQTLKEREDGPNYALFGNPKMYKNLEIGNKYTLEIREPLIGSNKLISTEPCE